ncbi:hypothetical protein ACO0LG_17030 [Undibacterium sp. Ji42W]|uniref:hypothetical protein n=1 Tax=Undibacterium sp. Ji42W TaxID=3413039 RepID=UPI003BF41424
MEAPKSPAYQFNVIDKTGSFCCKIAIKIDEKDPLKIARNFMIIYDHPGHKEASLQRTEDGEWNFPDGEIVQLVEYKAANPS